MGFIFSTADWRTIASMSGEQYELYYWGLAGRAEFARIIFEEVGVKFKETNDQQAVFEFCIKNQRPGFPSFAPPVLKKGTRTLALVQHPFSGRRGGSRLGIRSPRKGHVFPHFFFFWSNFVSFVRNSPKLGGGGLSRGPLSRSLVHQWLRSCQQLTGLHVLSAHLQRQ